MEHYKKDNSTFQTCIDYLMLTWFGIVTTVIPLQILDTVRFVIVTFIVLLSCCRKNIVQLVESDFDYFIESLTSLTNYQVQCIKYSQAIS